MEKAAQELGISVQNLLKEITTGRITSDEAVALKNLVNNNARLIINLEDELLRNPAQKVLLQGKINLANQQIDQALKKIIKGGTEGGRLVASFRILANNTLEPQFWFTKAQKCWVIVN